MKQSIIVYADDNRYVAVGGITHERLFTDDSASQVIQQACAATSGEVLLESGEYTLTSPIRLRDNVTLRGRGRLTCLRVRGETGIHLTGINGAQVTDLRLIAEGARYGVIVDNCGDCKVRDVICMGFADYGLWLCHESFLCEVRGCSLAGNGKANLYLDHLALPRDGDGNPVFSRMGLFLPNLITQCLIYGGGKGIECRYALLANIVGCTIYHATTAGIHLHSISNSVLINGCRTYQTTGTAILIEDSNELNLSGNVFCWHTEHGIVIRRSRWGVVTGNEIIDTGSWNSGARTFNDTPDSALPTNFTPFEGIQLRDVHGYTVSGNTIFNWPVCPPMQIGIDADEHSSNNTFTGNNINYYLVDAISDRGVSSTVANNIGCDSPPHYPPGDKKVLQSYDPTLTSEFINMMMR